MEFQENQSNDTLIHQTLFTPIFQIIIDFQL